MKKNHLPYLNKLLDMSLWHVAGLLLIFFACFKPAISQVSDDFNSLALDTGTWTVVDPLGDSTIEMNGSQLSISVPQGSAHDVWTNNNSVPQVRQPISDTDLDVVVKFESTVDSRFQQQGLLFQTDSNNLVRAEFQHNGTDLLLFAARKTGGAAATTLSTAISIGNPNYLRVTRTGDDWTLAYSSDGVNWTAGGSFTHELVVTTMGVFAGNAFGKSAHTAVVDYVFNTTSPIEPEDGNDITPPAISDVQVQVFDTSATITWTTDESATSQVDYGLTAAHGTLAGDGNLVTAHSVTLTGLDPQTEYHYAVTSLDALSNGTSTADATFTTTSGPDTTPPVISDVQVQVSETSATISWTTDELATSQVSYGADSSYGTIASDAALVTAHSVTLTDLTPGTTYHYEVTSVDASNNPIVTADATFATAAPDTTPPVISDVQVQVSDTSATISWTTDEPATSQVNYGLTLGYGTVASDTVLVTAHSVTLTGLTPETTYNYAVTSADVVGNGISTANATFITTEIGSGTIVSDDFNALTLDTSLWTVVDPLGDATFEMNGTQLSISVPKGTAHDVWTNNNSVPQVQQPINDTDLDVVVKFESIVESKYQQQGLLFQTDSNNLVRIEFQYNGADTLLFAARMTDGSAAITFSNAISIGNPNYLRVTRTGNEWILAYSPDGVNWTAGGSFEHELVVTTMGVFAGNAFGKSAHTAVVDYVFNTTSPIEPEDAIELDATPPVISDVQVQVFDTSATITWTTDEPATSQVDYGPTSAYGTVESDANLVTAHSVTLTGLNPETTYHYAVTSADASSSPSTTADATFTTAAGPDTTPPVISNVQVQVSDTSATISWTTDESATSQVSYGADSSYGTVESNSDLVTVHSVTLTGLTPETPYHYTVISEDASSNGTSTADATFTTAAPDTTPPVISNVQVQVDSTSATITWTTDEPATSQVDYGTNSSYGTIASDPALVTAHSVMLTGLTPETTYHYEVTSVDASGNPTSTVDATFITTEIGSGTIISDDFNALTLDTGTWTVVDPKGDSTIEMNGSQLSISVPAGSAHDVWTNNNSVPRVQQAINDTDLEVVAKFESEVTSKYQQQGFLFQADSNNLVRIEFQHNGTDLLLFAARMTNGSAATTLSTAISIGNPNYLRVTRTGDDWTLAYSSDGVSWTTGGSFTHQLTVTTMGVFAGNAFGKVAHTAVVDYVFNTDFPIDPEDAIDLDAVPPVISDVQVQVFDTSATISWTTDEPATSQVDYGIDSTYGTVVSEGTLRTAHSVTLTGLNPETLYHYAVTSADASGNETSTADAIFTTTTGPDTTPPEISDVQVQVDTTSATITWTTDEPATSQVDYGLDSTYGTVASEGTLKTIHSVTLTSLTSETTYYYTVTSVDASGNETSTADAIFATAAPDTTPPVISNIQVQVFDTSATISWTTDEPATSQVDYGQTTAYGSVVSDPALVAAHSVTLTGLDSQTQYYYAVTSVDASGNATSVVDTMGAVFNTTETRIIESDDFNALSLNTGLWTVVDPLGDSTIEMNGTQLLITVPKGSSHRVWSGINTVPQVQQRIGDTDFEVVVKFDSTVNTTYQEQGLLFQADSDDLVLGQFRSDATSMSFSATKMTNGVASIVLSTVINISAPNYLRVTRTGDVWTMAYSPDGVSWTNGGSFTHELAVTTMGVFAGNTFGKAEHTAVVDYVFNTASPIQPEDEVIYDTVPPANSGVRILRVDETSATIGWITDELAMGEVAYGLTPSYEIGSVADGASYIHSVTLTGLSPNTQYNYEVTTVDGAGNLSSPVAATFSTTDGAPSINVWYGPNQEFGHFGMAQIWMNILGNVYDPDGVASLTYSLNAGPDQTLTIGPDGYRLAEPGDFNADIYYEDLNEGINEVVITATDTLGNTSSTAVTIDYDGTTVTPLPYSVDWSSVTNVQDVVQVVDGGWAVTPDGVRSNGGIRNLEVQYDRLLAVGDVLWGSYEITVPITVHSVAENTGHGVGLIVGWTGHTDEPAVCPQPKCGWAPSGPWAMWLNSGSVGKRLQLGSENIYGYDLQVGVRYIWKVRVEETSSNNVFYGVKIWEDGTPEPLFWTMTTAGSEVVNGSILLVSWSVDSTFGDITITPIE